MCPLRRLAPGRVPLGCYSRGASTPLKPPNAWAAFRPSAKWPRRCARPPLPVSATRSIAGSGKRRFVTFARSEPKPSQHGFSLLARTSGRFSSIGTCDAKKFGADHPLFPKTKVALGDDLQFQTGSLGSLGERQSRQASFPRG